MAKKPPINLMRHNKSYTHSRIFDGKRDPKVTKAQPKAKAPQTVKLTKKKRGVGGLPASAERAQ